MRIIKARLVILILSLIAIISIMSISIKSEADKIDNISESYKEKLIRFHVIANSDTEEDQELKLKVRDKVISYLQPKLENSSSIEESEKIITNEYDNLQEISRETILDNGYDYDVKVGIEYSNFPTKQYSNVVLPAGEYKALKVVIGEGKGKNWWCVMFPPLCFVDEENGVIDKSTDDKLQSVLDEEEYKLITTKNKEEGNVVKFKFKIVEVVKDIF
ncbi:stage II sporulation protein R [Romboutsia ilealis]|uniref:Stage II sporulation protein R n=1 Tax=Romboutsia faecis TaxID=2764597 RepID=A0ABR7JTL0_9FIRM|nr:stage II sporulation protein R [Romboutsia faecis]MBC5998244.1 stage II sporulation protein R [Romboutsia faecis]MRN25864.1 stage II sporulation protein R [Romboutsia ilealis]